MLARTLKWVTEASERYWGSLEASMCSARHHKLVPSASGKGKGSSWQGELGVHAPEQCRLLSSCPGHWVKLVVLDTKSSSWDCFLESGEWEFPLDRTVYEKQLNFLMVFKQKLGVQLELSSWVSQGEHFLHFSKDWEHLGMARWSTGGAFLASICYVMWLAERARFEYFPKWKQWRGNLKFTCSHLPKYK